MMERMYFNMENMVKISLKMWEKIQENIDMVKYRDTLCVDTFIDFKMIFN